MLARPAAAAAAGFDVAEMWWPWNTPVPNDSELDALCAALADAGVRLAALNFDAGDIRSGDCGLLSSPSRARRLRDNIDVAVGLAQATRCPILNALYGDREDAIPQESQDEVAMECLTQAAQTAHAAGALDVVGAGAGVHASPPAPSGCAVRPEVRPAAGRATPIMVSISASCSSVCFSVPSGRIGPRPYRHRSARSPRRGDRRHVGG